MNNSLKKMFIVLILVVGVFVFTGCGKDKKADKKVSIVGTWVYVDSDQFVYTFNKDGSGKYEVAGTIMEFTYKISGNKLSMTYKGDTEDFETEYSIKDDTLNIKDSLGEDTLYKRK